MAYPISTREVVHVALALAAISLGLGLILFLYGSPSAKLARETNECREYLKAFYVALCDSSYSSAVELKVTGEKRHDLRVIDSMSVRTAVQRIGSNNRSHLYHRKPDEPTSFPYLLNPEIEDGLILGRSQRTIVACDRPGNHYSGSKESVSFLLADGSRVTAEADPSEYADWASRFATGKLDNYTFPPPWTNQKERKR